MAPLVVDLVVCLGLAFLILNLVLDLLLHAWIPG